jgi:hypothetical protein
MAEPPRCYPSPWRADTKPGGHARDADGQALAFIYSRNNQGEAGQAKFLTKDEAHRAACHRCSKVEGLR